MVYKHKITIQTIGMCLLFNTFMDLMLLMYG